MDFSSAATASLKRVVDIFLVADGRFARGRDDLRLIAVGEDMGQVVSHHVLGLGLDRRLGFEISIARTIAENRQTLLKVVVAEHVLKRRIHPGRVGYFGIVGSAFIDDLQRHPVLDRLAHRVFVDVVAEDPLRLVDRRAGIADAGRVRDALVEVGAQHGVLGTMRLVRHDEDVRAGVQLRESLRQVRFAELVDHRHDQIRGIRREQFLQLLDAVRNLDREADALAGFGKLVFKLGPVGDEHDLPLGERGMPVHLPHHEHHGQGFARALRVPDDAAALARGLAFEQALHRELHGAELLVTPDDLDDLALVVGGEQREGADDVEQIVAVEHAGDQALLVVRAAAAVIQIIQGTRERVRPAIEMLFVMGGDGAEFRFLPAGRDDELVVIEQRRAALALGAALFAVAQQLVDGFGDGLLDLRRLAFDDHDRQAVQEQHDVRDDVMLGAEDAHLELADGNEAIVVPVLEIDEAHRRAFLARLAVLADAGVFQQQIEDMPVVLDQAGAGEARGELLDNFLHLIVFKPRVDDLQLLPATPAA